MTVKTTINSTNREVTFHLDQTEVTIPYTTFRQLMSNGGVSAAFLLVHVNSPIVPVEDEAIARIA